MYILETRTVSTFCVKDQRSVILLLINFIPLKFKILCSLLKSTHHRNEINWKFRPSTLFYLFYITGGGWGLREILFLHKALNYCLISYNT